MRKRICFARWGCFLGLGATLLGFGETKADFLPDRASLNALLGARAVSEPLETYQVESPRDPDILGSTLSSTTVVNGQGPGLVKPGVIFSLDPAVSPPPTLQWNPSGYFGLTTKTLAGSRSTLLAITFSAPTTAFGVAVKTYVQFSDTVVAVVYAADGVTELGRRNLSLVGTGAVFLGYSNPDAGIGRVTLTSTTRPFTPVIDDLAFGALPRAPLVLSVGRDAASGTATVTWQSAPAALYRVQWKAALEDAAAWQDVGLDFPGTGGPLTWTDDGSRTAPFPAPKRFYRVTAP